jgi:hypothetical protein
MLRRLARLPLRAARRALVALQRIVGEEPLDDAPPVRTSPTGPARKPAAAPPAEPSGSVAAAPPWQAPPPRPAPVPEVTVAAEPTPNPNAMKFNCSVTVVDKGSRSYDPSSADVPAWARALLALEGVRSVFAVRDFVTVTKEADADWAVLVEPIGAALRAGLSRA